MKKFLFLLPIILIFLGASCDVAQPITPNKTTNFAPSVSQEDEPVITTQQPAETPPAAPIYTPSPKTYTAPAQETYCCKYCSKGKACGDSCISRSYTCHKPPGCACDS